MIRPGCDADVSARPDHAMLKGLVAFQLELTLGWDEVLRTAAGSNYGREILSADAYIAARASDAG